jgi:hypothetical protein
LRKHSSIDYENEPLKSRTSFITAEGKTNATPILILKSVMQEDDSMEVIK